MYKFNRMCVNISLENGLSFELNEKSFTAAVSVSIKAKGEIKIPKFINHNSHQFFITKVKEESFQNNKAIKSVKFSEESVLKSIEKLAFSNSSIEFINIPSTCTEIDESCFIDTQNLSEITISPLNNVFEYLDSSQKFIVRKSGNKNVLFFTFKDVKEAVIPSTINEIGSFSFYKCEKLKKVEFSSDFSLKKIEKCAFLSSSLPKISIPKSVTEISDYSFSDCDNLRFVKFHDDSELAYIGQCAFSKSSIEHFCLPKKVAFVGECAFSMCSFLKSIEFLGEDLMCKKFCFYLCQNLYLVSFPNSKKVPIQINSHDKVSKNFVLFVCPNSKLITND